MNQENHCQSLLLNGFTSDNTTTYNNLQPCTSSTIADYFILIRDDDDDYYDLGASQLGGGYLHSKPFLFLDMMWNSAFVVVSVCMLLTTVQEKPSTPLRLWICGYALQCLLHVVFVWDEYQSTTSLQRAPGEGFHGLYFPRVFSFSSFCCSGIMKKLESINTIVSSIWWVFGFYWIIVGGQPLLQGSPRLYWLSVVFLAFDVFFMFFCIAMACVVFFLLFCCFPILATVAYAMTTGDGASEKDIKSLPKFLYRQQNTSCKDNDEKQSIDKEKTPLSSNSVFSAPPELGLNPEDSECCICLYKYIDGTELCKLPCNDHFHYICITKWLRINATCPLCKFNILKGEMLV